MPWQSTARRHQSARKTQDFTAVVLNRALSVCPRSVSCLQIKNGRRGTTSIIKRLTQHDRLITMILESCVLSVPRSISTWSSTMDGAAFMASLQQPICIIASSTMCLQEPRGDRKTKGKPLSKSPGNEHKMQATRRHRDMLLQCARN